MKQKGKKQQLEGEILKVEFLAADAACKATSVKEGGL